MAQRRKLETPKRPMHTTMKYSGPHRYVYFTGKGGKWARLPDYDDPEFADAYEQLAGHRPIYRKPPPSAPTTSMDDYLHSIVKSARARAKKAGRKFEITTAWAKAQMEKQGGLCAMTGLEMTRKIDRHDPWAPSIDRISSARGYTDDNCQLVCYIVNCAKNQFTERDLRRMCRAYIKQWKSRTYSRTPPTDTPIEGD